MAGDAAPTTGDQRVVLALAFAAVVGSFAAANVVVDRSSATVSHRAEEIIQVTAPNIEYLARVRDKVLEAELSLSRSLESPAALAKNAPALDEALRDAETNAKAYFATAPTPGEHSLMLSMQQGWLQFSTAVANVRRIDPTKHEEALESFVESVEPARARLLEAATRIIEHNAVAGRDAATDIRHIRERTGRLAAVLHAVCALLAAGVAWLLHRQFLHQRSLVDAYVRSVEDRSAELEQFAGRVAHDIRGPLAAARLGAELVGRGAGEGPTREVSARVISSLGRAEAITSALLEFARAGAKPDPGARTQVSAVLDDLASDVLDVAREARVELRIEKIPDVYVACSAGAYISMVSNLVRNAIKYMGASEVRRVTVRVELESTRVRTEVSDTGPGIPEDKLERLFDPFFRDARGIEGLGLGLATVKKLVEGHDGQVGVESTLGKGSTFWFDLPRA